MEGDFFEFRVMPFGLANSPKTMVRLMDIVNLDATVGAISTLSVLLKSLLQVFQRLTTANLTINFKKHEFCRNFLKFSGFFVDIDGLSSYPGKVSAVLNYPTSKNSRKN